MNAVPEPRIALVTPVWNDSERLEKFAATLVPALAAQPGNIRWIIADDGSEEAEIARLETLVAGFRVGFPATSLFRLGMHQGKGGAVRGAFDSAGDADWLAFCDADGAVTAEDMLALMARAIRENTTFLGVRTRAAGTEVREGFFRSLSHRGFLFFVRAILGLHSRDTQCGAKVFRGADFRRIRPHLAETGYAFDAEWLYHLRRAGIPWREAPVNWQEKPGAKIRPVSDGLRMLGALLRIRRAAWRGGKNLREISR